MLFRISSHADAESAFVFLLKGTDGLHEFVGMGIAGGVGRKSFFTAERIPAQRHHVFNAEKLEILQQGFRLVGRSPGTDQMGHHLHLEVRLDSGADGHGADPVADDAAAVTAVGLAFKTDFVAVRGDIDVTRRVFHQGRDARNQFVLADAVLGRDDFKGGEGCGPALDEFGDFHSRCERKRRASSSVKPRAAAYRSYCARLM